MNVINFVCHLICFITVLIYALINIRSFLQNEDLCEVSFKKFHNTKDDIYPSMTICQNTPFDQNRFDDGSDDNVNISTYENYLVGKQNVSQKFANIKYKNVSIQLNNFLIKAYAVEKTYSVRKGISLRQNITEQSWGSFWGIMKCFSFNVPFKKDVKLSSVNVELNNSIFPNNGQRPVDGWKSGGIHVSFHYPKQFVRSFPTNKRHWQMKKSEKNSHHIQFYVKDMEVLRKRQKKEEKCLEEGTLEIDDWFIRYVMNHVKCSTPYWSDKLALNSSIPVCNKKEQLRNITSRSFRFFYGSEESVSPCTEIVKISTDYAEPKDDNLDVNTTKISVYYRMDTYKEIKQMRAYTGMMLLGNVGGFFGILLGYAVVQVPDFLNIICKMVTHKLRNI